eukprot:scaffold268665_cov21-Tisochrysis_lutea.AAC.1
MAQCTRTQKPTCQGGVVVPHRSSAVGGHVGSVICRRGALLCTRIVGGCTINRKALCMLRACERVWYLGGETRALWVWNKMPRRPMQR